MEKLLNSHLLEGRSNADGDGDSGLTSFLNGHPNATGVPVVLDLDNGSRVAITPYDKTGLANAGIGLSGMAPIVKQGREYDYDFTWKQGQSFYFTIFASGTSLNPETARNLIRVAYKKIMDAKAYADQQNAMQTAKQAAINAGTKAGNDAGKTDADAKRAKAYKLADTSMPNASDFNGAYTDAYDKSYDSEVKFIQGEISDATSTGKADGEEKGKIDARLKAPKSPAYRVGATDKIKAYNTAYKIAYEIAYGRTVLEVKKEEEQSAKDAQEAAIKSTEIASKQEQSKKTTYFIIGGLVLLAFAGYFGYVKYLKK
jgi:hypothetical protein